MTRVAVFTDNDFVKVNGVTTTLRAVLRGADWTVQPRIYTAADIGADTCDYFAARSVGAGLPWYREMKIYWPPLAVPAKELRASGASVVHVTTPGPVGLAGRWLARWLNLPLTGSYHTHFGAYASAFSGSPRLGRLVERYMRWFYGPCDPLFVPSEATRACLTDCGYQAPRLRIWSHGVDAERFAPARRSAALREAWQVDNRRPAVLYAGRLSREKGLDLVAPVRRRLLALGLPHRFIFVGDGPMAAELRQACDDAVFLGSVPHDEVAVAMASADVFFFPSDTDSFGNVVLEALASGLPVLVSDRGGPQEQIRGRSCGIVCRALDSGDFAGRLAALLQDRGQRELMGAEARRVALGRGWPEVLRSLFAAWREASWRSTAPRQATPRIPRAVW